MPIVGRGGDDLLLDAMVTKLEAFRAREVAINSGVNFELARDRTQPWKDLTKPLVNLEIETDEPENTDFKATVKAYCLVPSLVDDKGTAPLTGAYRLYYLKEQVRCGLLALLTPDLGLTLGTVELKKPQWARIHFQDREMEQNIIGGAWTFECLYAWEPEDITTTDLTDLVVSVGPDTATALWAAAYHYT